MSYTVGDWSVVLALAAGVVGYLYVKHQSQQKKIEIIHQERMAAMEKDIPLPEFPFEPTRESRGSDPDNVIPILGMVLFSLSIGAMIVLFLNLPVVGLIAFHLLKNEPRRSRAWRVMMYHAKQS